MNSLRLFLLVAVLQLSWCGTTATLALQFPDDAQVPQSPRALALTLADVVDVLADYEVIYERSPVFCAWYYGLTDYEARTIRVCANMSAPFRRSTVIHELLHAVSFSRSIARADAYTEGEIAEATERIYRELYGRDVPSK